MKKTYYIVTNLKIIQEFKKSRYFRVNLGMSVTMEKNGERILSDKDQFAASYNYQYKTSIYAQGMIGNIKFYIDHYIKEDKIAAYLELEEFVFDYDENFIKEKGIDSYIGHILMNVDEKFDDRKKKEKEEYDKKVSGPTRYGDPDKLIKSPGSVTYEDIVEYMKRKRI